MGQTLILGALPESDKLFSMNSLNNREIAWLAWLSVVLIWILTQRQIREALWECVKAFCAPQILRIVALMLAYVGVCIVVLAAFHIWQWDNLKTTLLWTLTFALVTMLDVSRISEDDAFYGQTVKDTVGATAVLIFIAELESFPLGAELLFVPALVFLGGLLAVAQTRPEVGHAKAFVESLVSIVGLSLLVYTLVCIWTRPDEFLIWATLREFAVPALLSLMFLPFMYVLSVYMVCDRMAFRLTWSMPDAELRSYAKTKAFFAFAGDLEAMRRWGRNIGLARPATRADVDASIREVLETRGREANPPAISRDLGWSPYYAKAIFETEGLKTNDYHRSYDGLWIASSPLKELDSELFSNNVSYAVEGNEHAATCLKLSLNVNNTKFAGEAMESFATMTKALMERAVPDCKAEKLVRAARSGRSRTLKASSADIQLTREDWRNGKLSGYKLRLSIIHQMDKTAASAQ